MDRIMRKAKRFLGGLGVFFLLFASSGAWALEGLQVGMKTPIFSLRGLDGETVSFSDFPRAKLFVIVFWSTWSENSGTELERLEQLYQKHKERGLVVLAVNVENQTLLPEDLGAIRKMVKALKLSFPILLDHKLETFRSYGVVAVPSTVVADKELTIGWEMAAYPIAEREDLFEYIEASVEGRKMREKIVRKGYQPNPKAVRYYNLARAMAGRGLIITSSTENNLKKSIDTDPKFVLPLILLGQVYREKALTEEAIEYGGKEHTTVTYAQERGKLLAEATSYFQKALELEPQNPVALTEMAMVHLARGQIGEGKKTLEKALQADSSHTPAHSQLGVALVKEGNLKRAQEEYALARKLNPLDYRVHYALAQAFEDKKMTREAIEAYKKGFDILWAARAQLFPLSFSRHGL